MVGVVLFSVRSLLMFTSVNRSNLLNANYKQLREQFKKLTGKEQKRLHREGSFERRNLLQFNTRIERRIITLSFAQLHYDIISKKNGISVNVTFATCILKKDSTRSVPSFFVSSTFPFPILARPFPPALTSSSVILLFDPLSPFPFILIAISTILLLATPP